MTEIDLYRTNALSPLGPPAWGWEIPVYLFLGGMAAGLMILSFLVVRREHLEEHSRWMRLAPWGAPILLSLGMLALFIDLEYRTHAYRFYLALKWSSPMSWGSWILLAIYPVTVLVGLAQLTDDESAALAGWGPVRGLRLGGLLARLRELGQRRARGLRVALLAFGIALGGYTGILLSTLGARSVWSSAILGPLFLVSGFSTGAALLMLFHLRQEEHHQVRRYDLWAIGAELTLIALFLVSLASGDAGSRAAAALFLGGRFTALFWSLVVVAGLVVPFVIETVESRRHLRPTRVAAALLLVGGLSLRWILVVAGQSL